MDAVTVNSDPIRIRHIVVTVSDPAADEEQEFVPPQEAEVACSEVRSALNRWLYGGSE